MLAAGLLGWGLTGFVLLAARNAHHLALPTSRGLHAIPTPVGGGLGIIGATLAVWWLLNWPLPLLAIVVSGALLALTALSWIDDRMPLPPALRFAVHALVVGAVVSALPPSARLFSMLPLGIERALIGFCWLWMLNLTNFMDGIDGLAGIEAVAVGTGYSVLVILFPGGSPMVAGLPDLALVMAAAAAGYLYWNWAPARIFMGDVGSIPLGFLFGLLMLDLAFRGHRAAALILPLYFIADATSTLLDRLRRNQRPWQAHREHAYQRAVLGGMSHAEVTTHIAVLNMALMALAVLSATMPLAAGVAAAVLTLALIIWLRRRGPATAPE